MLVYRHINEEELWMDRPPLASGFIMERYLNAVELITPLHLWVKISIWSTVIKLRIHAAYTYILRQLISAPPEGLLRN